MGCKHCGTIWSKDVTNQELLDEVKRRREDAQKTLDAFFLQMWKSRGFCLILVWLLPLCYLLLCLAGLSFFGGWLEQHHVNALRVAASVFLPPLALFAIMVFLFKRTEKRLLKQFAWESHQASTILFPK